MSRRADISLFRGLLDIEGCKDLKESGRKENSESQLGYVTLRLPFLDDRELELQVEVVIGDPSCVASHSPPSSHPFFLIVDDDDDEWLISPSPSPATLLRALRFRPPHDISQRRVCAPLDAGTPPSRLWRQQQYAGVGTVRRRYRHRRGRVGRAGW